MKVGGQRRLFIPWQLAYGTHAIPEHGPGHPGIPAKSDLIFDVELVDMADIPVPQAHPDMPKGHPTPGANVPSKPDVPASSAAPSTPAAAPATAPNSATPTAPAASTQPQAK
jgi:peptidylprolyl isomerase